MGAARIRLLVPVLLPPLVLLTLGVAQLLRDLPLWYDELYTAEVAPLPLATLAELVRTGRGPTDYLPAAPPSYNAPYYALMHLWLQLPLAEPTAGWLRVPSLVCAAVALGVLAVVVRRLAGPTAALVAGLLAATAPLLVEQSVEARSYGPALLAVAVTAYGVLRWLDGASPLLFGIGALSAGLLHWFALPAVAGLALGALVVRGRQALPLIGVGALAALPTVALVALALSHDTVGSPTPEVVGLLLPALAVRDWGLGQWPLVMGTAVAAAVGLARSRWRGLVGLWLGVPLAAATALELVRPSYYPRYLLFGLVALPVLAALGAVTVRRPRLRAAVCVLLIAASFLAVTSRFRLDSKERGPDVVALLAAEQRPGEPVVAADARAALNLDHYVEKVAPRLRADLVLPPDDAPADASGPVWLVRFGTDGQVTGSDDDALLLAQGYSVQSQRLLHGLTGDLVVQRWER